MENNSFDNAPYSGGSNYPPYVTYVPYGFTPKTYSEKKGIRKTALVIGIAFIVELLITTFWATGYFFVMGRLGFTVAKAREIITDPAALQVAQIVLSSFIFTVPFIIVFKSFGFNISETVPLKKPQKGNRLTLFLLGISFCSFANIATSQASSIFESFGINYNVDYGEDPKGFFGFCLSMLSTVIVPALVEEFACRGLILGSLRKYGDGFAVLTSAIVFGLMHGNFEQMPFAFIIGLVLGFIVVKTDSLLIAMAVHAFNNFVSVFFSYFAGGISAAAQNAVFSVFLLVCLLAGIISLLHSKNQAELFKFGEDGNESKLNQRFKWFFTSPCIIIFTVFCILESLQFFM